MSRPRSGTVRERHKCVCDGDFCPTPRERHAGAAPSRLSAFQKAGEGIALAWCWDGRTCSCGWSGLGSLGGISANGASPPSPTHRSCANTTLAPVPGLYPFRRLDSPPGHRLIHSLPTPSPGPAFVRHDGFLQPHFFLLCALLSSSFFPFIRYLFLSDIPPTFL